MFRLTNLATSHLPETDNIFYWQILKNWHFFHILQRRGMGIILHIAPSLDYDLQIFRKMN